MGKSKIEKVTGKYVTKDNSFNRRSGGAVHRDRVRRERSTVVGRERGRWADRNDPNNR